MVTRRCSQRLFLLKPSKKTNQLLLYCIAYAAKRFDISVHSFVVMANHFHIILTDRKAQLPRFMHWLDQVVAKAMNSKFKRWENFWAPGSYSMQKLVSHRDVIRKMVYVITNPVTAGLVNKSVQWPGVTSAGLHFGEKIEIEKPDFFFKPKGKLPNKVSLSLTKPPAFARTSRKDLELQLEEKVLKREREIRAEFKKEQREFMGKKKIMNIDPKTRPNTEEPRRNLSPNISAKDKDDRIAAIAELMDFRHRYKKALSRWRKGDRDVKFPYGTYRLRIFAGVNCEDKEPSRPG